MSDDLVQRVAREFCTVDGTDPCEVVCGLCLHRAGIVVALCMEEAAKMLEARWAYGTADHQAAAIRAMIGREKTDDA